MLAKRLAARHGHFFPEQLLGTQLDALDPPGPDERVISVVPDGYARRHGRIDHRGTVARGRGRRRVRRRWR